MGGVLFAKRTVLAVLPALWVVLFIFLACVIDAFAYGAGLLDVDACAF